MRRKRSVITLILALILGAFYPSAEGKTLPACSGAQELKLYININALNAANLKIKSLYNSAAAANGSAGSYFNSGNNLAGANAIQNFRYYQGLSNQEVAAAKKIYDESQAIFKVCKSGVFKSVPNVASSASAIQEWSQPTPRPELTTLAGYIKRFYLYGNGDIRPTGLVGTPCGAAVPPVFKFKYWVSFLHQGWMESATIVSTGYPNLENRKYVLQLEDRVMHSKFTHFTSSEVYFGYRWPFRAEVSYSLLRCDVRGADWQARSLYKLNELQSTPLEFTNQTLHNWKWSEQDGIYFDNTPKAWSVCKKKVSKALNFRTDNYVNLIISGQVASVFECDDMNSGKWIKVAEINTSDAFDAREKFADGRPFLSTLSKDPLDIHWQLACTEQEDICRAPRSLT